MLLLVEILGDAQGLDGLAAQAPVADTGPQAVQGVEAGALLGRVVEGREEGQVELLASRQAVAPPALAVDDLVDQPRHAQGEYRVQVIGGGPLLPDLAADGDGVAGRPGRAAELLEEDVEVRVLALEDPALGVGLVVLVELAPHREPEARLAAALLPEHDAGSRRRGVPEQAVEAAVHGPGVHAAQDGVLVRVLTGEGILLESPVLAPGADEQGSLLLGSGSRWHSKHHPILRGLAWVTTSISAMSP